MKKSKMALIIWMLCGTMLFSVFAAACKTETKSVQQTTKPAQENRGGELKIAIDRNPKNINPIFADDTASENIDAQLFSGLLKTDEKGNILPNVASELPTVDEKNKTITFKLNQGWKWHDGQELTSDDVKFSYDLICNKDVNSPRRLDYQAIISIETPDKYTVVLKLKEMDSQLITLFTSPLIVPKHILEKYDKKTLKDCDFSRNPIGSGPFKFIEWKTSERLIVEAFDGYLPGKPKLDRIIYDITPSQPTAVLKVETGEDNYASLLGSDMERMQKNTNLNVISYASTHFDCIQWNTKSPFFSDKTVRQALNYALNKEAMIAGIYKGMGNISLTSYPSSVWVYNPNVKKYDYDIEMAKKLLDSAGWKVGADGIRVKDGKKFEFDLLTNKGDPTRENSVVFIQNAYKDLGIKVHPKILEWNTLFDSYIGPKKFDAYVGGYNPGIDIMHDVWYIKDGMFNDGSYENPRVDELFKLVRKTFDKEEQKKYIFEIQDIIAEEQPLAIICNTKSAVAISKKVKDAKFFDNVGAYQMEKWYVEK